MPPLSTEDVERLAEHLENAELGGYDVVKITDEFPDLTYDDAYAIQDCIRRRKEARGVRIVGLKMGLTSLAKMKQMGVHDPICGFLAETFARPDSDEIKVEPLIHPKVEPEIAFVTKAALWGPDCSAEKVMEATDFVIPALEIIDSRYQNFRFDLPSVVADNCSSSRFVLGSTMADPREIDLRTLGVVLMKNGQIISTGAGAAVLGDPAQSVATLANMLATRGQKIPAATLILSGAVTAAVAVEAGDSITARFQHLGTVCTRFI